LSAIVSELKPEAANRRRLETGSKTTVRRELKPIVSLNGSLNQRAKKTEKAYTKDHSTDKKAKRSL
jgi:hypothetical protein